MAQQVSDSGDWVSNLADQIERSVGMVRDRTTRPAIVIARGLVFGLLAAILALVALVLVAIIVVRVLNNYLPGGVWVAHLITGTLFTTAGLIFFAKRHPKAAPQ